MSSKKTAFPGDRLNGSWGGKTWLGPERLYLLALGTVLRLLSPKTIRHTVLINVPVGGGP
ncbi:hypothetical protein H6G45_01455 [Synechocystis sp. FACHB-383]|uniref:hypothetical protein n=1 Tax=unclassified Synechocystis TaxID=2640012 RepID=UPI0016850D22|nr:MULTISPECIES: hypothetical protein [unclassified Synechocystis]MBD2652176.1 hypothetical protein [Synechocystis sp. FACHB-383]MBE9194510.1 hypothetical protein [Synechocystis sp. LEGE 06083]